MKNILLIIIDILFFVFFIMINTLINLSNVNFSLLSLILVVYIILSLLPIKKGDGFVLSFLLLYCIFIFGRAILQYVFNYVPSTDIFDSFNMFTSEQINQALLLGGLSLLGLHLGVLLKKLNFNSINEKTKNIDDNNRIKEINFIALNMTGWLIFGIAIIPAILNYVSNFSNQNSIDTNSTTLLNMLAGLMLPFFIILMINKRKNWTFYLGVIYLFPQFFWGGRGRPVLQLAILFYIYVRFIRKEKFKISSVLLLGSIGIFLLNLFVVIKENRSLPLNSWIENFFPIYLETLKESNALFEVIYEIGVALAPTAAVIKFVPELIPIQYGKTIIYSIFTAVPDILGIRPTVMDRYGNIPNLISLYAGSSFGGSILQDFFVNFMWFTPVVMIIVGFILAKYSHKLSFEQNPSKVVFLCILIYPVLWWPRSSLGFMFRNVFVTSALPFSIYIYFKTYLIRRWGKL